MTWGVGRRSRRARCRRPAAAGGREERRRGDDRWPLGARGVRWTEPAASGSVTAAGLLGVDGAVGAAPVPGAVGDVAGLLDLVHEDARADGMERPRGHVHAVPRRDLDARQHVRQGRGAQGGDEVRRRHVRARPQQQRGTRGRVEHQPRLGLADARLRPRLASAWASSGWTWTLSHSAASMSLTSTGKPPRPWTRPRVPTRSVPSSAASASSERPANGPSATSDAGPASHASPMWASAAARRSPAHGRTRRSGVMRSGAMRASVMRDRAPPWMRIAQGCAIRVSAAATDAHQTHDPGVGGPRRCPCP